MVCCRAVLSNALVPFSHDESWMVEKVRWATAEGERREEVRGEQERREDERGRRVESGREDGVTWRDTLQQYKANETNIAMSDMDMLSTTTVSVWQ